MEPLKEVLQVVPLGEPPKRRLCFPNKGTWVLQIIPSGEPDKGYTEDLSQEKENNDL